MLYKRAIGFCVIIRGVLVSTPYATRGSVFCYNGSYATISMPR